ncbi:MAG: DUF1638 domain-containing protein [Candidatus Latescibacteria bacterium]|jgi:hypothetical protein|nr:DUF1638 domain-containing protein [Candidatus Latescibacterota bacterium]
MKLYVIACEVFCREFRTFSASSPHLIDMAFQPFGLHDTPDQLRLETQQAIDKVPPDTYDYILIGYGLCSRGTAELVAGKTPLVMVRAHDCITFFLGSKERYLEQFTAQPGTYYYSSGWIERKEGYSEQGHIRSVKLEEKEKRYAAYVEQYGEDNASYLIDMETQWLNNYGRAALIDMGVGDRESYRAFVQEYAEKMDWEFQELPGDTALISSFLAGDWDPEKFLVVPPGQTVNDTYDDQIIAVEEIGEAT